MYAYCTTRPNVHMYNILYNCTVQHVTLACTVHVHNIPTTLYILDMYNIPWRGTHQAV